MSSQRLELAAPSRIIFVLAADVLGGGEQVTLKLASALQQLVPVAIVSRPGSSLIAAAESLSIPTAELDIGPKLSRSTARHALRAFLAARRRLLTWLEDHTEPSDWCCFQYKWEELLWGGTIVTPKVLICEHGPIPLAVTMLPPARRRLCMALLKADMVIAWSDPARDAISAVSGRKPIRLNAGVDRRAVQNALAMQETQKQKLVGGAHHRRVIVYSGRLAADKGVDHILMALGAMGPDLQLVVLGDGPERERLITLAQSLGVASQTSFLGHIDDPLPVVAAADALLLLSSSRGEGRPLAAIEAAAVGTPVIGLNSSPALRALEREGLAHTIPSPSAAVVAAAVQRALTLPRLPKPIPAWSDVAERVLAALEVSDTR